MFKALSETKRCELLEVISRRTWNSIIEGCKVGQSRMEPGVTTDIIIEILTFSKSGVNNFDVYAQKSRKEDVYGSDMDVFVETRSGKYRWFALQAKVMKYNEKYTTLRDTSDGFMQWDKLKKLEAISGCKSYYLLFNGKEDWKHAGMDSCNRSFNESQFGCSLVESEIIKQFAEQKGSTGKYINPNFEDIHPQHALPWRILTCCYQGGSHNKLYTADEVKNSLSSYKKLEEANLFPELKVGESTFKSNDNNNAIVDSSEKANWHPEHKLVVTQTTNSSFK